MQRYEPIQLTYMLQKTDIYLKKSIRTITYIFITGVVAVLAFVGFGKSDNKQVSSDDSSSDYTLGKYVHADVRNPAPPAVPADDDDGDGGDGDA